MVAQIRPDFGPSPLLSFLHALSSRSENFLRFGIRCRRNAHIIGPARNPAIAQENMRATCGTSFSMNAESDCVIKHTPIAIELPATDTRKATTFASPTQIRRPVFIVAHSSAMQERSQSVEPHQQCSNGTRSRWCGFPGRGDRSIPTGTISGCSVWFMLKE